MAELILKDEVYAIAGAAMEVYYTLGIGFLEPVYQAAIAIEFNGRGIPYAREPRLDLSYKQIPIDKTYRPDFVCYDQIIVELKCQTIDRCRRGTDHKLPEDHEEASRAINELWIVTKA